jgi:uncharacterized membrane protein YhhN
VNLRQVLALVTADMHLPFSYALTTWSAGALAHYYFGGPRPSGIFAFLLGGIGAYVFLVVVSESCLRPVRPVVNRRSTLINVVDAIAAVVVSVVARFVQSPSLGYLVTDFTGTLVYMLVQATALWFATRRDSGTRGDTCKTMESWARAWP